MTGPVWPYRAEAVAAYRAGPRADASVTTFRPARWPTLMLVVLFVVGAGFAAVVRVPRSAVAGPVGVRGAHLVAVAPGRLDPLPAAGMPARASGLSGWTTLSVVHAEIVGDRAAASAWNLPPAVPLPCTVVTLAGDIGSVTGRISVRVANPTVLQRVPGAVRSVYR